ncbi:APG9-domain-containing protein [Venturia nashicola]|nr:APG9-domain-containing protein [Venturia nashicola]
MASNILSRLLPSAGDDGPSYSRPRRRASFESDPEDNAGMAIDEENLGERFQDQDLEALLAEAASDIGTESVAYHENTPRKLSGKTEAKGKGRRNWLRPSPKTAPAVMEDDDDDVPASLMLEGRKNASTRGESVRGRIPRGRDDLPPVPGPTTRHTRQQWEVTRTQQRLHNHGATGNITGIPLNSVSNIGGAIFHPDPKQRALWKWAQVQNLDNFLTQIYDYYLSKGIYSIALKRILSLFTTAFVVGFSTFMFFCIDYSLLPHSNKLSQVRVPKCTKSLPGYWKFFLWAFAFGWLYLITMFIRDIQRLVDLKNFFHYLLDVPDKDIQTVTWQYIVQKLMDLRDENPATARPESLSPENRRFISGQSKQRMDAHDIANRLMRQDNYLIAMINKDILDCTINIPFLGKRQFFTKTVEWNLWLAVAQYAFDENNQIRQKFLHAKHRQELVQGLKRRFFLVGCFNLIISPFIVVYFLVTQFLQNFTEYQKNPSRLSSREWTPMALWKFREFNELKHFFERRKIMAYPYADSYLDQFPKDKVGQVASFVTFVSGGLAAVLGVITLLDSELFLGFEIDGKSALFWLGVLGGIWQVARGMVPADDVVSDPETWLTHVMEYTHFSPKTWENRLHTEEVRQEFSVLYKLELFLLLEEIASVIFTPLVLMFSLPPCAGNVIDFFREFTVHVDGLGHVCSYAMFDFKRGGEAVHRAGQNPNDLRNDYWAAKDNKLAESYQTFMMDYGDTPRNNGKAPRGGSRNKRQFHPPPSFPGLAGSRLQVGGPGQSLHITPRFGPLADRNIPSPMHSVLLDPHHQPRSSPRQGAQTRLRGPAASRQLALDPDEHEEEFAGPSAQPRTRRTSSKIIEEDSDLGDSWAVKADAGMANEPQSAGSEGDGVGVLGMLYQFSKAQTEGRGIIS